jgi:2'-5' RNA ligase
MPPKETLYFIAIIPPPEICEEITRYKQDFAERYSCRAALKLIPHITLKAPFKIPPAEHTRLLEWFHSLALDVQPFHIQLKDFGVFPKKVSPVIYIRALMNEHLQKLQDSIINAFRKTFPQVSIPPTEQNFSAHLTIAYRDLKPEDFSAAWTAYRDKKYDANFTVTQFHVLQHDETKWNIIDTYSLAGLQNH